MNQEQQIRAAALQALIMYIAQEPDETAFKGYLEADGEWLELPGVERDKLSWFENYIGTGSTVLKLVKESSE